jgi:hypothetical protein
MSLWSIALQSRVSAPAALTATGTGDNRLFFVLNNVGIIMRSFMLNCGAGHPIGDLNIRNDTLVERDIDDRRSPWRPTGPASFSSSWHFCRFAGEEPRSAQVRLVEVASGGITELWQ